MDSNNNADPGPLTHTFLPEGESCDNCNSTTGVQKFKGSDLCKSCRNQWAAMK